MAEINQFGSEGPGDAQTCARCEALLMDALDHTASPEDQVFFDRHLASCVGCSRMFMDAKRGAAWLEMLRDPRPEPGPTLLPRILARTSGAPSQPMAVVPRASAAPVLSAGSPSIPFPIVPANVLPFRPRPAVYTFGQRILQPRLAMTAAMAFFSIALTLNLTGIRVTELRAGDLRPANLRRGFHEANAHMVRYYDNLRVVYELEARVHDLQRTAEPEPDTATPQGQPAPSAPRKQEQDTKPTGKPGPGTSLREPLFPESRSVALEAVPATQTIPGFELSPVHSDTQSKGDRS